MGLLRSLEQRLTDLLEGGFARVFRGGLPPSELLRAAAESVGPGHAADGRTVARNLVRAAVHPEDLAALTPRAAQLGRQAAEAIRASAQRQGLELAGRPRLILQGDPGVARGLVDIVAEVAEGPGEAELVDGAERCVLRLRSQPARIGRDAGCELVLDQPGVSRIHARLEPAITGWALADLGSTNGTLVNGRPTGRQQLRDGDLVEFGPVRLRFRER